MTRLTAFLLCLIIQANLSAQQDEPKADLTDGLLDLLGTPDDDSNANVSSEDSPPTLERSRSKGSPPNGTLEGRDSRSTNGSTLASASESGKAGEALRSIHADMQRSAEYLSNDGTLRDARLVQNQILKQFDELIEQLSRQNQTQQSSSQSSGQQQSSKGQAGDQAQQPSAGEAESQQPQQQAQQGAEQGSEENATGDEGEENSSQDQDPSRSSSPGQSGTASNVSTQLLDPKAMQEGVWGQLPEQVRKQMQSRMVERFLPAYQEQIEAYFRALLKGRP